MIETKLLDSLTLILPNLLPERELKRFSICKNEPFSFQMAYRIKENGDPKAEQLHFFLRIESDLDVKAYGVGNVPVLHSFERIQPKMPTGLYPDVLVPKETNPVLRKQKIFGGRGYRYVEPHETLSLVAYNDSWNQLWFTVNEDENPMPTGAQKIKICLYDQGYNLIGENELTLDVMDVLLPEQKLFYTCWFHNDCLGDFYGLELFDDEYFAVLADFLAPAVKNGMNMVLMPAFTPPLDTPIGEERRTAQLVKVKAQDGKYTFDFSLMKRYIDVCRSVGLKYFEHSHFFTQWGAEHAPKIMAEVDGVEKRIFGWETDAAGEEYVSFLRQYIPAVKDFLKGEGLLETTLFHISDEPTKDHLESYEKSRNAVADLLEDCLVGDALSDYRYYESGLVKTPIARNHKVMDFVGKCEDLWVYYTGADCYDGLSNRLIQLPRQRNRIMGTQLYAYRAKGFLHWGYNFYYGALSHGLYNPLTDPCCGFPNAGTTYSVYPGRDRKPLQSIHQKIFAEGLVDLRSLELLESLGGREECEKLIAEYLGETDPFNTPDTVEEFILFRRALNDRIAFYLQTK